MFALLKASFFKLRHDLTLKITLCIGAGLALLLTIIYFVIDLIVGSGYHVSATGQNMLLGSFSPYQNFGIAIPINLVIFTIMEFNQGTIRNKVVVGNSKLKIYISLLITGLLFTFALLVSYAGLSTALGCLFGRGFKPNYTGSESWYADSIKNYIASGTYITKFVIGGCLTYVTITCFTVFCGTLTRHIGPSIPLILVPTIFLCILPTATSVFASEYTYYVNAAAEAKAANDLETYAEMIKYAGEYKGIYYFDKVVQYLDPFYLIGNSQSTLASLLGPSYTMSNDVFIGCIVANVIWSTVFSVFGALIFCKRDLK